MCNCACALGRTSLTSMHGCMLHAAPCPWLPSALVLISWNCISFHFTVFSDGTCYCTKLLQLHTEIPLLCCRGPWRCACVSQERKGVYVRASALVMLPCCAALLHCCCAAESALSWDAVSEGCCFVGRLNHNQFSAGPVWATFCYEVWMAIV